MSHANVIPDAASGAGARGSYASVVSEVTADLAQDTITLLGYPDIAVRIQRALVDENVSTQQLVRLVGSEPVLTSRILCMANSVALNPRGSPVADLASAIRRMGLNQLRGAVASYAMAQLRATRELQVVAQPLRELWQKSVVVAALCGALARNHSKVNPDLALLTGLLHSVGKLYLLIKSSRHPEVLADDSTQSELACDWHVTIASALLEQWKLPPAIVEAVSEYEYFDSDAEHVELNLTGILYLSTVMIDEIQEPEQFDMLMSTNQALTRFGISAEQCRQLVSESEKEIAGVMESLGL